MLAEICQFYYGIFTSTIKARLIAQPPKYIVLNTPGGSYKTSTPTPTDISDLQAVGIKVLSYVSTGNMVQFQYNDDSPQNDRTFVRGCIDAVATEGCDGIFFDEGGVGHGPAYADKTLTAPALDMYGEANSWSGYTMQDYTDYCHSKGMICVAGLDFYSPTYLNTNTFDIFDFVLTDESYAGRAPDGSEVGYEDQCWVISGGITDSATAISYTNTALGYGFNAAYICIAYGTFADWYEDYASAVYAESGGGGGGGSSGGSTHYFNDVMKDIVLKIDQRKIYNDIRSQIDETVTTESTEPATYDTEMSSGYLNIVLALGASTTINLKPKTTSQKISWLSAEIEYSGSDYNTTLMRTKSPVSFVGTYISVNGYLCSTWQVTNTFGESVRIHNINGWYQFEKTEAKTDTLTNQRKLMVRATDETSINKYGRRTLNLTWPLGQSQAQMQSLVEQYRDKYKEPIPLLSPLTIQGSDDELIEQIFTRKISDKITVSNTPLGMFGQQFFINRISGNHSYDDLVMCDWECEAIGIAEQFTIFTVETSELDSADVLG